MRKLTDRERYKRAVTRALKREQRQRSQAGGRARWAGSTPEQRAEWMRSLALGRHRAAKAAKAAQGNGDDNAS